MVKGHTLLVRSLQLLFCVVLVSLSAGGIFAQTATYYVQLTDKQHNSYSIDKPASFLSPKAIERRKLQNISIKEDDLPVSGLYLQKIASNCSIAYALKWSNGVVIHSDDPSITSKLLGYPFVSDVRLISRKGPSTRMKELDYYSAERQEETIMDSSFYGAAHRQSMMIHINALHEKGYWGDSVIIAMMDAGFPNVNTNPYFQHTFDQKKVLYTWDFVYGDSDVYSSPKADQHGAETFSCIASNKPHLMVGTAPNAKFMLFHTEDVRSETIVEEYNWAAAAEVADSMGAEVFSTSLGYTTFDASDSIDDHTYADMTGHTTPIAKAVNKAASKGIIVVNSAGNEGASGWHYIATPGDADSGATVGAVTPAGLIAGFSSRGPNSSGQVKPDVCAQGAPAAFVSTTGSVITGNGTSFSCPITAGAFACLRQAFPSAPNMVIIQAVRQSCNLFSTPNADYGYGIPDFGMAYDLLKALYPTDTLAYISSTRMYPNPFTTSFKLIMTDELRDSTMSAELFDITGQKVWSNIYPVVTFTNNVLEVTPPASLAMGVYILRLNKRQTYRLEKKN